MALSYSFFVDVAPVYNTACLLVVNTDFTEENKT